ncbi:MAG: type II secretion system protein [Verrucomicrobiota bacterium]
MSLASTGGLQKRRRSIGEVGFSLVELLVVIAIVAVLASLIVPALGKAKQQAQGMQCLSNTRQLTLGWLMYADDHDGSLCPNGLGFKQGWVQGILNFDSNFTDNTNLIFLTDPQYAKLAPYVSTPAVYMCPADRERVRRWADVFPTGEDAGDERRHRQQCRGRLAACQLRLARTYRKINYIGAPSPSSSGCSSGNTNSINDGRFEVDCQNQDKAARLVDFPANFHNNASGVSFADGHAETHRWVSAATLQPNKYCGCLSHYAAQGLFINAPHSPDLAWLQERTSAKK